MSLTIKYEIHGFRSRQKNGKFFFWIGWGRTIHWYVSRCLHFTEHIDQVYCDFEMFLKFWVNYHLLVSAKALVRFSVLIFDDLRQIHALLSQTRFRSKKKFSQQDETWEKIEKLIYFRHPNSLFILQLQINFVESCVWNSLKWRFRPAMKAWTENSACQALLQSSKYSASRTK